jgi:hypothetical protein
LFVEVTTMPPPPPQPSPDTLTDIEHPVWQRADTFRAILFGALAVLYAVLLFPLTVAGVVIWLIMKVLDRQSARQPG